MMARRAIIGRPQVVRASVFRHFQISEFLPALAEVQDNVARKQRTFGRGTHGFLQVRALSGFI